VREDSKSGDLARQLRDMAEQLQFLEKKLVSPATQLLGRQYFLDGHPVDPEVLSEFKSSLDRTRHSVWALLEALSGYSAHAIAEALQEYRMQRASELLHALRPEIEAVHRPNNATARSFFEEIEIVSELAARRHMRQRK